jgi:hypothetical protein
MFLFGVETLVFLSDVPCVGFREYLSHTKLGSADERSTGDRTLSESSDLQINKNATASVSAFISAGKIQQWDRRICSTHK